MCNYKDTIGILTYSNSINYGACLQTYALQAYLKEQGFSVEEINYSMQGKRNQQKMFFRIRSFIWKNTLRAILKDRKREKKTALFRKAHIQYTDRVFYNFEDLKECHHFDSVIVGSDQVWNPQMIGMDPAWFLSFAGSAKKLAYGASFGISKIPDEYQQFFINHLKHMNAISVREESGAEIVESLIKKKPAVVVDPVFLLNRSQWEQILVLPPKSKYILCYYMPGFPEVEAQIARCAQEYAHKHGLQVVNLGKRELAKLQFRRENLFGEGPAEFLGWIRNAEAVITNSFHGTAFSLIFEKKFLSVVGQQSGRPDLSSRITNLLSRLDMEDWIMRPGQDEGTEPKIIPEKSKETLQREIEKSKYFLYHALEV